MSCHECGQISSVATRAEDRKRRKEHERKSTKRTDEVEQETENQEEAARTSQKSTYFSPVLFLQCLESEPESCCGVAYTTYHVDLSSDDGCEHRLFRLILEVLLENRICMLNFLQFLWMTRVRMPRATVVRIISVILFLRLVMWLHEETVPLGVGRVLMLRILLVTLCLGRLVLRMSASTFPDYSDCGQDGDDSVRNIARLLEEFDTLKVSGQGGASASFRRVVCRIHNMLLLLQPFRIVRAG